MAKNCVLFQAHTVLHVYLETLTRPKCSLKCKHIGHCTGTQLYSSLMQPYTSSLPPPPHAYLEAWMASLLLLVMTTRDMRRTTMAARSSPPTTAPTTAPTMAPVPSPPGVWGMKDSGVYIHVHVHNVQCVYCTMRTPYTWGFTAKFAFRNK